MKDLTRQTLEKDRPDLSPLTAVNFCLEQIYKDQTYEISDLVVQDLTFEELIGALLLARDQLEEMEKFDNFEDGIA